MKVKFSENFKYITSTSVFKLYIIITLFINVYGVLVVARTYPDGLLPFVPALISILNFPYYHIIEIIGFICIELYTIKIFKQNQFQLIRLYNKENSLNIMLKQVIFNCSICYLIQIIFLFIGLIIFHFYNFKIEILSIGVTNLVYSIFLLLRSFIFMIMIIIINGLLHYLLADKFVVLINMFLIISIPNYYYYFPIIQLTDGSKIPVFISGFFATTNFQNFSMEFCVTMGYLFMLTIVCYVLYNLVLKFNKQMI